MEKGQSSTASTLARRPISLASNCGFGRAGLKDGIHLPCNLSPSLDLQLSINT